MADRNSRGRCCFCFVMHQCLKPKPLCLRLKLLFKPLIYEVLVVFVFFSFFFFFFKVLNQVDKNGPPHDKTNKIACAPSEDSDQPGHQSLRCPHE